jgi:carboxypeptidase PM20D1
MAVAIKDSPHAVKTLEIYKTIIEIPTVAGRDKVPEMATYLTDEFREVSFSDEDIQIIPKGETVGLIIGAFF